MQLEGTKPTSQTHNSNQAESPRIPADTCVTPEGIPRRLRGCLVAQRSDHWVILPLKVTISVD